MKKIIAYISALVLIIFLAAISAIIFLSFTVAALVVAVAGSDDTKIPSGNDADSALASIISSENAEPPNADKNSIPDNSNPGEELIILVETGNETIYLSEITKT